MPLLFDRHMQPGSDFRLLGRQSLNHLETYVVAFAQRGGVSAFTGRFTFGDYSEEFLVQGVVWIDASTYQIQRIKTWFLRAAPMKTIATNIITDVDFSEVRFKQSPAALWLPRKVEVTLVWRGRKRINEHAYSHYQVFRVQTEQKPPQNPPGNSPSVE